MTIKYLKKSPKTSSTDDFNTREIVQKLLNDLEKSKEVENYPRIISDISRNSSGVRAEIFNIVIGLSSKA